ncbi:MAG: T9SS type A sorting domain-containing protein [Candidatus Cloacimonetes bacterium]|nr:T9SS type A sorting domain-containing protein [Candidatus Cloacimonadota bacterium]
MRKFAVVLLICLLLPTLATALDVSGSVSGIWTVAQSPINVVGDIYISQANQLQINAGVDVVFTDHYKFEVFGRLVANGNAADMITFSPADQETGWNGIRFIDTFTNGLATSVLTGCHLEYGLAVNSRFDYQGGAIYCENSSDVMIQNSIIDNNMATTGGGIYLDNSSISILASTVSNNNASGAGGGIYMKDSNPILNNVRFINNNSQLDGAGINCFNSDPTITRCLFAGNSTEWNGGGISAFNNSDLTLINNTFTENIAYQDGCALALLYNSSAQLMNSILWYNDNHEIFIAGSASLTISYTDIMNGEEGIAVQNGGILNWGLGIINVDPEFEDPLALNYELLISSPCIDAGNPDPIYNDPDGTTNDLGAYSYQHTGLRGTVTINSGNGDVEDVIITISGDVNTTLNPNALGGWFIVLGAGTYNVTASMVGYHPNPMNYNNLVLDEGDLISGLDFLMIEVIPGAISGTVALNGLGYVGDVEITAGDVTVNPQFIVFPYEHWEYFLEINPGTYNVTASLPGYQDSTYTGVTVQPSVETEDIDFVLQVMEYLGYVQGTVTLMGGSGNVEDVIISDDTGENITSPGPDGVYILQTVNGNRSITATLGGYTSVTLDNVIVSVDQTTMNVDFTLLPWDPITGNQYVMTRFMTVTYNGLFVCNNASNQIGAFWTDPTDPDNVECRGVGIWVGGDPPNWNGCWPLEGGYWWLTVRSNNNSGEIIHFKVFETTTNTVYDCPEIEIFEDCTYDEGLSMHINAPSPVVEQQFDLIEDWNWISFNLHPENTAVDAVFAPLIPDVYQVKSQTQSATYTDPVWLGDLDYVYDGEGYKVYMNNSFDDFTVSGTEINCIINPIALSYNPAIEHNYNWVAYYPRVPLPIAEALYCADISYAKSQTQSAIFTGGVWIGDLTTLYPGQMYIIDVESPVPLTYPGPDNGCFGSERESELHEQQPVVENRSGWKLLPGNKSNMTLISEILVNGELLKDTQRYEIGIFDVEGTCRSIGKAYEDFWYFTVLGYDEREQLQLRIFDKTTETEYPATGFVSYETDTILGSIDQPVRTSFDLPDQGAVGRLMLDQNYPNPFNPQTEISYSLPVAAEVQLEIFNLKGQLVETLVNSYQEAGNHAVLWNADAMNSGIYFYKLKAGNTTEIKKCILMK